MVFDRGNGIYRGVIAALVGLVIVATSLGLGAFFGALYAPHYSNQSEKSADSATNSKKRNPSQIDRDRAGLPYFAERIASAADPKNADEREQRDLAAQEAAALWGFWILVVSAIGSLTTIIGTGFLLWQIMLTREAVIDTGKATEAMREANSIARNSHQMQLRAYIGCIEIKAYKFRSGLAPSFGFKIKNAGQSPALRVRCYAQLFVEMDQTPHEAKIRFGGIPDRSVITILPGQSPNVEWQFPHPLDAVVYKAVTDGTAAFVYAGIVEYWDIFGKRHISTFKNFVNREQMGSRESLTLSACSKGNYSN
ncbi:MAG: hypothetical protein ABI668_05645 [Sphingorhabdus sp.]